MIKVIFSTFFTDFALLLSGVVVWYFSFVGINAARRISYEDNNIFTYTLKRSLDILKKNITVIGQLFLLVFIIHCISNLYDALALYVQQNVNYETVPFVALLVDMLRTLFTFINPFIGPVIIALVVIVVMYGFFTTMEQYSVRANLKSDILDVATVNNTKAVALYHTNGSSAEDDTDSDIEENDSETTELNESDETNDNNYQIYSSSKSNKEHKRRIPRGWFHTFCNNSLLCFGKIAKFLPKIFLVVAICIGANTLFLNVKSIGEIANNQKRINELNMTIKNLSRAEAVAEISLVNEVRSPDALYPIKTYKISVLDEEGDPIDSQTQVFTLEGEQLAIDTMNINFDYSEISKGEHYNIAYPYRIHTDVVTSENGIPFKCFTEDGTSYPVMYGLENSVVYSMDRNTYYKNLTEIFEIAKDEARANEAGIRSFVGQDIHEPIYKGETYRLIVTGTGGVKLSKVEHLDVEEDFSDEEVANMYNQDEEEESEEKKGFFSTAKDAITGIFSKKD